MLKDGSKLGPYEILSPLGAGGMGEVYRAKDTTLGREVAVKILPEDVASDSERLQRFEREAKTIATLNHPNIVTIYGIHHENHHRFIAMELVEGETLHRTIAPGGMPLAKIFDIAVPLADALAAAHDKGIVHRDLKPGNVMVTKEGRVKVLDFGLAKLTAAGQGGASPDDVTMSAPLTGRGTIVGTVPYMSPEQLQGEPLDHRTDLFSLGILLYEMSTGQRPFEGKNSATITSSILRDTPRPLHELNGVLPRHLGRIIEHCLEKDAEHRYQSAKDVRNELRALRKEVDSGSDFSEPVPTQASATLPPTPILTSSPSSIPSTTSSGSAMSAPTGRGEFWIGVGVLAAIMMIAAFWIGRGDDLDRSVGTTDPSLTSSVASQGEIDSLAVLPFENLSHDPNQDIFVDSITEAITDDLAKISALHVKSSRTMMYYKGTNLQLPEIAKERGVQAFVTGSAMQVGERVQVRVHLVDALTGEQLWSNRYEDDKRNVLAMQQKVARAVADEIRIKLTNSERDLLTTAPRVDPAAYDAYIAGRELVRRATRKSCTEALAYYDTAIEIDPGFALAYAARSDAFFVLGSLHVHPVKTLPAMKQAAERALELDENLSDAHIFLGYYYLQHNWEWKRAGKSFERALELNPNNAKARLAKANYLVAMNRIDEGMAQLNMVMELDPAARYTERDFGGPALMARRYERSIRDGNAALEEDPTFWPAHQWMGLAQGQLRQYHDAIYHLRTAADLSKSPAVRAMLGWAIALSGDQKEARSIRAALRKLPNDVYVCPYEVATISIGLQEYDEAFEDMHSACDDRAVCVPWLQVDPRLDPIRDDPRFDQLLEHVGFEPTRVSLTMAKLQGGKIMLAVLPFENLGNDPEQEYFSDGMTEEMITRLGRLRPELLGVIARTSAMRYKKTNKTIAEVGRELGVAYVIEGGVRRSEDSVRISTQLIQVSDQTQLWGDSYTRDLSDVFAIQAEVAEAVALSLAVELLPEQQAAQVQPPTKSSAAYDAYLLGRSYWAKRTPESLYTAVEHFKRAIEIDPNYALAYSGLADTWGVLPWYVFGPYNEMNAKAKKAAEKALSLDDSLAESHVSMAFIMEHRGNVETAIEHYRKAVEIDPNNATAHQWYGLTLATQGRFDEATVQFEKAITLDPLSAVMRESFGAGLLYARRFDKSVEQLNKALELQPDFYNAAEDLTWVHLEEGDHDAAAASFEKFLTLLGQPSGRVTSFHRAYETSGLRSAMLGWLDSSQDHAGARGMGPVLRADWYAWCGENDKAFEWLHRGLEEQDPMISFLGVLPAFDNLRDDPRFDDLLRQVGLDNVDLTVPTTTP